MNLRENHLDIEMLEDLLQSQSKDVDPREVLPREIEQHLVECEQCRKLIEMYSKSKNDLRALQMQKSAIARVGCPPEKLLRELAAGVAESPRAEELTEHVIECDHCGPRIREITEELDPHISMAEEQLIEHQSLSDPRAQMRLARILAEITRSAIADHLVVTDIRSPLRSRILLFSELTAGILVCAALAWTIFGHRSSDPNSLLARAYSEQRPFDFRLDSALYGPFHSERGPRDDAAKSHSLIAAELKIKQGLLKRPSDPMLLEAKGKAELLELRPDQAIDDLSEALQLRPKTLEFLLNLATAYALRGDQKGQTSDYSKAHDVLSEVLQIDAANQVALFNRALLDERTGSIEIANKDWNAYLNADGESAWAGEAREHLKNTSQH